MDNELKFYLLAEEGGWDCSTYAFEYRKVINSSSSYQILAFNMIEVKKHLSFDAKKIANEFDNLKLEPRTLEETFILETKINHLCLHSFPEYYINPLSIDPNYLGELTTIGELIIRIEQKDYSINDLILDEKIPMDRKKEAIREKVNHYVNDMNQIVHESIDSIRKNQFISKKVSLTKKIAPVMEIILFILINSFLLFTLLYPQDHYWECFYNPRYNYALTYVAYGFPFITLLYDFFFALFHSLRARVREPLLHARKFLKSHSEKIYNEILQASENLYDYIIGAMTNRILLEDDIRDFSKLSSSYLDFKVLNNIVEARKKKSYTLTRALNYTFSTIAYLVSLLSLILYIYSTVLNVSF
jgi:hypothetical protein